MSLVKLILSATLGRGHIKDARSGSVVLEVPEIIGGKYKILNLIGHGSYGTVFLVEHTELSARFALKLLDRALCDDPAFAGRFKREATALLSFTHEGSVPFRDFGATEEGQYYLVTDYVEGELLDVLIAHNAKYPPLVALHIIEKLLQVLEAAHAKGIVHRDVKPSNIMIVGDVQNAPGMKLLDFGIAKLREQQGMVRATVEGFCIGTPEYMSPEQSSGNLDVDNRADLYAAGVLFYELLTGEVPFTGANVMQILLKHLTQLPPRCAERLRLPPAVDSVIERALAKNPAERFQSAAEMLKACQELRTTLTEPAEAPHSAVIRTAPPAHPTEKRSILMLDDSEMILNIAQHIFERDGFTVFTASSFGVIHDILFAHRVRLMLCDVEMPGVRGPAVCRMLKESVPDLTILLFSNIDERELARLAIECAADGYIDKNQKPEHWLNQVRLVLDKQRASNISLQRE